MILGQKKSWIGLIALFLFQWGCGEATPTPTPAATPTLTPPSAGTPRPALTETPTPTATGGAPPPQETGSSTGAKGPLAPELAGITGWINSAPFALASLRGKVVLIDFWTYTCVNCIRTFPFLKEWYDKYADRGLVIVGVHSPEFEFEKKRANVEAAAQQYGLKWPIAQDNDFRTWRAFNNRAWPAKYLIDEDGLIRYSHLGEGAYDETEQKIRELLEEAGAPVADIPANPDQGPVADPKARVAAEIGQTRELYAGYAWNYRTGAPYIGNVEYLSIPRDTPAWYQDPGGHKNHVMYLNGQWTNGSESVTHARLTENLEDYLALQFFGTSVNVVLDFEGGEPFEVVVSLDGAPLPETHRGADIQVNAAGRTFFQVNEARMYLLLEQPEYSGHELRLASNSDRFSVFAFTFGSYSQGP